MRGGHASREALLRRWSLILFMLVARLVAHHRIHPVARKCRLRFYHTRMGERLDVVYRRGDRYIPEALEELDHYLRDHRTGDVRHFDPCLFDLTASIGDSSSEIADRDCHVYRAVNGEPFSVRPVVMMRARHHATLSIVSLLLAHLVFGQASSGPAAQAPLHNSTNGTIVLGGGYLDDDGISALLRRAIGLASGARTSLVIIPTADPRLEPAVRTDSHTLLVDYETAARVRFAAFGVNHLTVLHTRDRAVADSDKFATPLRSANCVWIPGGDPELLFEVYPNTTVQRELQRILDQGGVIVGDSAGAEIIGQGLLAVHLENPTEMPTVGEVGLRLLKNTFVMTHVNRYKAGIVEQGCNTFVCAHPEMLTLLIGENTAVIIQHDQITRLLGSGRTGIVDGSNHASHSPMWLSGSARYDLRRRILIQ